MACYNLMEVEKTVETVFQMLISANMDVFIHTMVITPKNKNNWRVHIGYTSYTSYWHFLVTEIFWYYILKFFLICNLLQNEEGERQERWKV